MLSATPLFCRGKINAHTMVQGFDLTMIGKALTWFHNLKIAMLYDFEILVKTFYRVICEDFDQAQHLHTNPWLPQKYNETIKECIDRLHQYIVRCLASKNPIQEHIISCF